MAGSGPGGGVAPERVDLFIEVFRLAALQAGSLARHLQGEVRPRTKEGFSTPESAALTAVDLAAQDVILYFLHDAFPHVAVDAEEETDTRDLFPPAAPGRPLIVVDPIDGSYNYARGSPDYAVMAAWLQRDRYEAAVVHLPTRRASWWARRGRGCRTRRQGGQERNVTAVDLPERVLVSPGAPPAWREALRDLGLEVEVTHCSAVDAAGPAVGRGVAAVSPQPVGRRRAIALLPSLEVGATVLIGGRPWDGTDPQRLDQEPGAPAIVADGAGRAARIAAALREAGGTGTGDPTGDRDDAGRGPEAGAGP